MRKKQMGYTGGIGGKNILLFKISKDQVILPLGGLD